MNPRDAQFTTGDWRKPHALTTGPVEGDHPELAAVSCSCGWSCMTEASIANKLGKMHLDRAKER